MKILAVGTYPIREPVHGGQRRTAHIGAYYRGQGFEYRHACVYDPRIYSGSALGPNDIPFGAMGGRYAETPFVDDLASGLFAASRPEPYAHFVALIERYQPDVIQLEQPFMWPLVRRLKDEGRLGDARLIYSSHNIEALLKREILEAALVDGGLVAWAEAEIQGLEVELAERADLLVSVSPHEAEEYRRLNPAQAVLVVRNGADRPGRATRPGGGESLLQGDYFLFVGSAYPPNVDGFSRYVLREGLYGFPPEKRFAICGGAADGIRRSDLYAPHKEAYQDRVQLFPRPTDAELAWLRARAKGFLLPIENGGGSNLKAAEALASGKWVVATQTALRSFEDFIGRSGVITVGTPAKFREAMLEVVYGPGLNLSKGERGIREGLFWDRLLEESGLAAQVRKLGASRRGLAVRP